MNLRNLTPGQLDAIQEIGNIGAGNAATALAQMVGQKVIMEVPHAGILPCDQIASLVGTEEEKVACINLDVHGDAQSQILIVFNEESAYHLADMLMGRPLGTITELDSMARSALGEIGNILAGSFLNAFAQVTGLALIPSVPALAVDMLGAVVIGALMEGGYFEEEALIIETQFFNDETRLVGHFFLLPRAGSMEIILRSLGMA